jgi:hypothetical protein
MQSLLAKPLSQSSLSCLAKIDLTERYLRNTAAFLHPHPKEQSGNQGETGNGKIPEEDSDESFSKTANGESENVVANGRKESTIGPSTAELADEPTVGSTAAVPAHTRSLGSSTDEPSHKRSLGSSTAEPSHERSLGSSIAELADEPTLGSSTAEPSHKRTLGTSTAESANACTIGSSTAEPVDEATLGSSTAELADEPMIGPSTAVHAHKRTLGSSTAEPVDGAILGSSTAEPADFFFHQTQYEFFSPEDADADADNPGEVVDVEDVVRALAPADDGPKANPACDYVIEDRLRVDDESCDLPVQDLSNGCANSNDSQPDVRIVEASIPPAPLSPSMDSRSTSRLSDATTATCVQTSFDDTDISSRGQCYKTFLRS